MNSDWYGIGKLFVTVIIVIIIELLFILILNNHELHPFCYLYCFFIAIVIFANAS